MRQFRPILAARMYRGSWCGILLLDTGDDIGSEDELDRRCQSEVRSILEGIGIGEGGEEIVMPPLRCSSYCPEEEELSLHNDDDDNVEGFNSAIRPYPTMQK